jgi:hypothetical protein
VAIVFVAATAAAAPIDSLATDDPHALADAVAAIERAPADPDALFAAARACEDRLLDPARALALYERILKETPDARVAAAADRRVQALHDELGAHGEHAAEAAEAAKLVAGADAIAPDELVRRGDALAAAGWPGAAGVARWLGDWLCRHGRYADAQARYQRAGAPAAAARCALDAHDWARAEQLAEQLPADDPVRDELAAGAARGRARARWYEIAWIALAAALAVLLASAVEIALRARRLAWKPPVEVAYFAPIAVVLVTISFTAHHAIAPAVLQISLVGLAITWLSGGTLELARSTGRSVRARSLVHVLACAIAVVAVGYIAITRDGLLEMLIETVRFGPQG